MYGTIIFPVRLFLLRVFKQVVHFVLAVDCHGLLRLLHVGLDGEVRCLIGCIRCWRMAFMIHSISRLLCGLWIFSLLHRLCLHCRFCIHRKYLWLKAKFLHHLTLDDLQSILFPLLVKLIAILELVWIYHLLVLNDPFLANLAHHLFWHLWYCWLECTLLYQFSLL